MSDRVYIFDTTLRDGEQSPGCSMTVPEKLRMARKLVELGVDILEAGFPIASEGEYEAVTRGEQRIPVGAGGGAGALVRAGRGTGGGGAVARTPAPAKAAVFPEEVGC